MEGNPRVQLKEMIWRREMPERNAQLWNQEAVPSRKRKSRVIFTRLQMQFARCCYITNANFSSSRCRLSIEQPAPSTRLAAVRAASGETP